MCIVLNAKDICVTGRKMTDKVYYKHTGQVSLSLSLCVKVTVFWEHVHYARMCTHTGGTHICTSATVCVSSIQCLSWFIEVSMVRSPNSSSFNVESLLSRQFLHNCLCLVISRIIFITICTYRFICNVSIYNRQFCCFDSRFFYYIYAWTALNPEMHLLNLLFSCVWFCLI